VVTALATLAVPGFGYRRRNGIDDGPVLPAGWFRAGDRDVFLWPLWTLPAGWNTLGAVWNVGCGSDGWKLTAAADGALLASIGRTHGVTAPNAMDHAVDLGIFSEATTRAAGADHLRQPSRCTRSRPAGGRGGAPATTPQRHRRPVRHVHGPRLERRRAPADLFGPE
jgi:hypothetical protein